MTGQTKRQSLLIQRLREAKDQHGLSFREMALDLHVTEKTIKRWLTGRTAIHSTRNAQIQAYLDSLDQEAAA